MSKLDNMIAKLTAELRFCSRISSGTHIIEVKVLREILELLIKYKESNKIGKWHFHEDGSATCDQCHRTQKNIWDYDSCQRYCGCCGADMYGGNKI